MSTNPYHATWLKQFETKDPPLITPSEPDTTNCDQSGTQDAEEEYKGVR
jgi:hypothetical protein